MEIIRGSLEDISRPASSEHTGSRVSSVSLPHADRICPTSPFSLVVLTSDSADAQIQSSSEETTHNSRDKGHEEENEDSKLQKALEEMRRLDIILSEKISRVKEIKRQRKELQTALWQDLLHVTQGRSQCPQEVLNTNLFLALEAPPETEEQENFVPVFETQVPDCDEDSQHLEKSEKRPDSSTESSTVDFEKAGEEQFEGSHCGSLKVKKKQDFVKRNIERVSGAEAQVLLTQSEKERLAELLHEIEDEEEESVRGGDGQEELQPVSVLIGQGYTPEPSDLEELVKIRSKLRILLPAEGFLTLHSSHTHFSVTGGCGPNIAWKHDGDPQPGEKASQYIKERREEERRLREIQRQLEILGQEMTDESPELTEEQLRSLLDECELTEIWSQDIEMHDTSPKDSS